MDRVRQLGAVISLLALAPASRAQVPEALARELRFARGLAVELDFATLGGTFVAGLRERTTTPANLRAVDATAIELAFVAAGAPVARDERARRLDAVLERTAGYLADSLLGWDAVRVRVIRAQACRARAASLLDEDPVADAARRRAAELCRQGLAAMAVVRYRMHVPDGAQPCIWRLDWLPAAFFGRSGMGELACLARGHLLIELARAEHGRQAFWGHRAADELEELLFAAPEYSSASEIGAAALGVAKELAGDERAAFDWAVNVADELRELLSVAREDGDFTPRDGRGIYHALWLRAELRCARLLIAAGRFQELRDRLDAIRAYFAWGASSETELLRIVHPVYGHLLLIEEAQAWCEAPGLDDESGTAVRARAAARARRIAAMHDDGPVRETAERLLHELGERR